AGNAVVPTEHRSATYTTRLSHLDAGVPVAGLGGRGDGPRELLKRLDKRGAVGQVVTIGHSPDRRSQRIRDTVGPSGLTLGDLVVHDRILSDRYGLLIVIDRLLDVA